MAVISENRQVTILDFMQWLAQGKGMAKREGDSESHCYTSMDAPKESELNSLLSSKIRIRRWDDSEWHIPTLDYMNSNGFKAVND